MTQIPSLDGIFAAKAQSKKEVGYTENQFLMDAIREIGADQELKYLYLER